MARPADPRQTDMFEPPIHKRPKVTKRKPRRRPVTLPEVRLAVFALLQKAGGAGRTEASLAEHLEVDPLTVSSQLSELIRELQVMRVEDRYMVVPK